MANHKRSKTVLTGELDHHAQADDQPHSEQPTPLTPERDKRNEEIGNLAGTSAGFLLGTRVGSVLIPIPFAGAFIGGLIGASFGSDLGKSIGKAILNGVDQFMQGATSPMQPDQPAIPPAPQAETLSA